MTAQPAPTPTSPGSAPLETRSNPCSRTDDHCRAHLSRECSVFCRYLAGAEPNLYVSEKYVQYHLQTGAFPYVAPFDGAMLRLAIMHPWLARVADSYSARFFKVSTLRKKLALLVGILECSPGYFKRIDSVYGGPVAVVLLRMCFAATQSAAALAAGIVLLGPLHAVMKAEGGWTRST